MDCFFFASFTLEKVLLLNLCNMLGKLTWKEGSSHLSALYAPGHLHVSAEELGQFS